MQLAKLPSGYPARVQQIKQNIKSMIDIRNSTKLSHDEQLGWLKTSLPGISNIYNDGNSTHIDFDVTNLGITVGAYILITKSTGRIKLGSTCVVFLPNDNYVDCYKW